ncbi:hypothetical protein SLS62_003830 [Diatrype stigma]|uniref:DUF4211 domain-containing protein n=1 Tax=Diatrype stigma TaxID=117547 RepID=A0AAN9UW12_9PEZI
MTRRPKRDKKRQARLTFEPAGSAGDGPGGAQAGTSSSPPPPAVVPTFSTAKVRYSRALPPLPAAAATGGSPSRPSPSSSNKPATQTRTKAKTKSKAKGSRGKSQSRIHESSLGVSTSSSPHQKIPSASFMPKQRGVKRATFADSSDESAAEVDDAGRGEEDDEDDFPLVRESAGRNAPRFLDADEDVSMPSSAKNPRSSQSVSTRLQNTVIIDDEDEDEDKEEQDDDDDDDIVPPSSALKRRRPLHVKPSKREEDDDDDDDDDVPVLPPSSALRRRRPAMVELSDDSDAEDIGSPTKRRKTNHPAPSSQRNRRLQRPPSSPVKRSVHKGHRSEKEKKMELLRRRRAGEKIDKLSSSESESEGERQHRGIYDTDSEDEFKVLKEFDDDEDGDKPEEEEEEEIAAPRSSRKKARGAPKEKGEKSEDGVDGVADGDLDDFVVADDEDGLLGAPDAAAIAIPLEFTAQAHRPLKEQFPYAVEWLVHNKLNPAFERRDPVYVNAWRKLDDEFRGLASSKFASSAWRTEFYRALKGRPKMEAYEMDGADADKYDNCAACGRSGHPATFKIIFQGTPYHKDTLQEVDDYDGGDEDDDDDDSASIDTQGMPLPPASREWHVGAVCCSNAETAHGLIHWKHALMEWVEERLEDEGWLGDADKARERERMKARQRRDLANRIADAWRDQGVVAALYRDWRNTLEAARTKATTGRGRMR